MRRARAARRPRALDPFYSKYLDGNGIPVLASAAVSDDRAVVAACLIVVHMLRPRNDVRDAMISQQQRVAVIGVNEVTTDIPEYRNLYQMFPGQDWDGLRGVGATIDDPGQLRRRGEPALPRRTTRSRASRLLVQTFATAVLLGAGETPTSTFESRVRAAYDAATQRRPVAEHLRRRQTTSSTTRRAFRAGSTRTPTCRRPTGQTADQHARRAEAYDPALASLIAETMPDDTWRPTCP